MRCACRISHRDDDFSVLAAGFEVTVGLCPLVSRMIALRT